ncbi:MAG TPA: serine hydrolase, partial [Aggregatilineaceae bacterium]|nr:serine hydrolase [Aggregatilineaceae bacterium]
VVHMHVQPPRQIGHTAVDNSRRSYHWIGVKFSRLPLARCAAAHLPFSKGFREGWQYQNMMYMTAGYLVGTMSGLTWEEFTQQRILDPLKMARTCFSLEVMQQQGNYATPYRIKHTVGGGATGEWEAREFYANPVVGPAGIIHSSVADLSRWLHVHVNDGRIGNQQFVSAGNLAQMHQPQMVMPIDGFEAALLNTTIFNYGLGWFIVPYRGYTLIQHGGNIDGFSTIVGFVPQAKIGVAVLTNIEGRPLRDVLLYEVCDRVLGLSDNQWNPRLLALYEEVYKALDQEQETTADERHTDAPSTHPLEAFVGEYAADGYPDFKVKQEGDQLQGWMIGQWFALNHQHYNIFRLNLERFEEQMPVNFLMNVQGEIDRAAIQVEPTVEPLLFKRKPMPIEPDVLAALVDFYDFPIEGVELAILLKKDKLFMAVTGQSDTELMPSKWTTAGIEFQVKDETGTRVEFQKDEQGHYTLLVLKQPGMVFNAPRIKA